MTFRVMRTWYPDRNGDAIDECIATFEDWSSAEKYAFTLSETCGWSCWIQER